MSGTRGTNHAVSTKRVESLYHLWLHASCFSSLNEYNRSAEIPLAYRTAYLFIGFFFRLLLEVLNPSCVKKQIPTFSVCTTSIVQVFYQGTTRKLKGDCSPQDIGMSCREGQNRVELLSADQESHAVVVQVKKSLEESIGLCLF